MAETLWARSALLGVDRESIRVGSRLLTPQPPTPLLCPLSSCGSNFNSTSVFINPLLASQGDRIQTLTRISPPDWLDTATPRGHSTKKETHFFFSSFPPPFTSTSFLSFSLLLPSTSYVLPFLLSPLSPLVLHPSLHTSTTSSCFSPCVPSCQSAVWATFHLPFQHDGQAPPGSDGVICLQKRAGIKKEGKKTAAVKPSDCIKNREEREKWVLRDRGERGGYSISIHHQGW